MKNYILLLCIISFSLVSCSQKEKYTSLKQMEWLTGSWQGTYNGGPFYEAWRKANDSMLVNLAIEIKGNDTLVKENGFIRLTKDGIINGGDGSVRKLVMLTDDAMEFRNDTLKFATRLIWSHSKNDHWLVDIYNPSGIVKYDLVRVAWLEAFVDRFIARTRH